MFASTRLAAVCCLSLALPVAAGAQQILSDPGPTDRVDETLILDLDDGRVGAKDPTLGGVPISKSSDGDAPVAEMPYIRASADYVKPEGEVSLVDSIKGTGRLRIVTDVAPVYCTGVVFGATLVATSYSCVPGVLDNKRLGATEIEEIRIVLDHVFDDQLLWSAQGYTLRLDTELSSKENGIAILHIEDENAQFAPDRIMRVGQKTPDPDSALWMLSHPRGGPMQFSHCTVESLKGLDLPEKVYAHDCDGGLGATGAPIFDARTGAVVGLHVYHDRAYGMRFASEVVDLANWIADQPY